MIDIILDTNILIYLFNKNEKYIQFVKILAQKRIGISIISFMEVLMGANNEDEFNMFNSMLSRFKILPLEKEIGVKSCKILRERQKKNLKDPKLADVLIGQTACYYDVPLITNNAKDFKCHKDLEIIVP